MGKFLKPLGIIISQIIVTFVTIPLVLIIIDYSPFYPTSMRTDPISLANTFTVFVTFIVVVGTVAITIVGIYFTSYFSKQKEAIVNDNIDEVINALLEKQDLKDKVLKGILKTNNVQEIFRNYINSHLKSQKTDFDLHLKKVEEKREKEIRNAENKIKVELVRKIQENSSSEEMNKLIQGVTK